ncbi:ABC transporter ATP-binding protein [Veillonella agrestimuris]|uniref:ABC transporter ATP-binding protein n=1 Tax=Veillonella agrestimuris TaxID=2941340 RepID=UPI00203EEDC0|nr:ABC transporter ATP-binding protein [Veillonella agrestimuris]
MKLEVKNLTTGYGETKIIENLNLTIPEGKITALIGANGCGKSTLLKTICRIIPAMDGDVLLDGKRVDSYDSRELAKRMAILPQNPSAPGELTVRELVMYGRAPHQGSLFARSTKEDREMVEWALKETDLLDYADRGINNMSGGQRQRAWIAMAIAQNTDILFLDEPTSFLDVSHQMDVLHLVDLLNKKYNKTIIMVIHELNEAARFADYLVAMKKGRILYEGTPYEIFHNDMLMDVFGIDSTIMNDPRTNRPFCIPYSMKAMSHVDRGVF